MYNSTTVIGTNLFTSRIKSAERRLHLGSKQRLAQVLQWPRTPAASQVHYTDEFSAEVLQSSELTASRPLAQLPRQVVGPAPDQAAGRARHPQATARQLLLRGIPARGVLDEGRPEHQRSVRRRQEEDCITR